MSGLNKEPRNLHCAVWDHLWIHSKDDEAHKLKLSPPGKSANPESCGLPKVEGLGFQA